MRSAIWLGRFQPPNIGHLATLRCILSVWPKVIVGIVHKTPPPKYVDKKWEEYLAHPIADTLTADKNPFEIAEILLMWMRTVKNCKIDDRVDFVPMPRLAFQPDFSIKYPEKDFDFIEVTPTHGDSDFDKLKAEVFSNILERNTYEVTPPFKLHNSEIKERISAGTALWSDVLPNGCYEIFCQINGPNRVNKK